MQRFLQPVLCFLVPFHFAFAQPFFQLGERWGNHENGHGFRELALDITGALHVDIKDQGPAFTRLAVQLLPAGAVLLAVHFGPFDEFMVFQHFLK